MNLRKILKLLGVVLAVLLLAAAVAYGWFLYAPEPAAPALTGTASNDVIMVGGERRSYLAYVPARLSPGAPIVLALHGTSQDGAAMRRWTGYELDQLADRKGFILLYPDGVDKSWNGCRRLQSTPNPTKPADDVAFMRALVRRFQVTAHADPRRVYALGYSNGGQLAFRVMHDAPKLLAGVATTAASLPTDAYSVCPDMASRAPIMLVNGTEDPINPYEGGENTVFHLQSRGLVLSALANAEVFARVNQIPGPAIQKTLPHLHAGDPTSVDERMWFRNGRPYVTFYTVRKGGHVVPQSRFRYPRLLGRTTGDLDMPREAIRFFGL